MPSRARPSGDKEYISKKLKKLKEETNIDLITCDKINYKNDINTLEENIFLEKRSIIENCNLWLKNYRRVRNRYKKMH